MKLIYDACRELLLQQRRQELTIPPSLLGALELFERANRGHKMEMDRLARIPQGYLHRAKLEQEDATRCRTLRDSTLSLLRALRCHELKDMPAHPALEG